MDAGRFSGPAFFGSGFDFEFEGICDLLCLSAMGVEDGHRPLRVSDNFREGAKAWLREDFEFGVIAVGWDGAQGNGFGLATMNF